MKLPDTSCTGIMLHMQLLEVWLCGMQIQGSYKTTYKEICIALDSNSHFSLFNFFHNNFNGYTNAVHLTIHRTHNST